MSHPPMNHIRTYLSTFWLLPLLPLLTACPTPAPTQPQSSAKTPAGRACDVLRRLKCPEGEPTRSGASCEQVWAKAEELQAMPAECVATAATLEQVRACGLVRCDGAKTAEKHPSGGK